MRALFFLLLCSLVSADPQSDIGRAYFRSSRAMSLKFLDGVYSIRSKTYRLIDQEGVVLSPAIERARMQQLLQPALKVEEESRIVSFRQDGLRAHCRVRYVTRLRIHDPAVGAPVNLRLDTESQDDWSLRGKEWLLDASRVTHQTMTREKTP